AKCRKVRRRESRLGHVDVFRMDCVRTSIIGRPRRLSAQRRAVSWNHRSTLSFTKSQVEAHSGYAKTPAGAGVLLVAPTGVDPVTFRFSVRRVNVFPPT